VFVRLKPGLAAALLAALVGCSRDYSPNTYSSAAAQQANKVDQGTVAGFREVEITPDGTVGAVTGGAAGGIVGAQTPGTNVATALGTVGGTLFGGLLGTAVERSAGITKAFEYVVRKANGELVSVTQKDEAPLPLGTKVLVIAGNQARIVPDYSVPPEPAAASAPPAPAPSDQAHAGETPSQAAPRATGAPPAPPQDQARASEPPPPPSQATGGPAAMPTEPPAPADQAQATEPPRPLFPPAFVPPPGARAAAPESPASSEGTGGTPAAEAPKDAPALSQPEPRPAE
jgi:outer membrane lipoprotein SlyB